jgi:hypothetical protein
MRPDPGSDPLAASDRYDRQDFAADYYMVLLQQSYKEQPVINEDPMFKPE